MNSSFTIFPERKSRAQMIQRRGSVRGVRPTLGTGITGAGNPSHDGTDFLLCWQELVTSTSVWQRASMENVGGFESTSFNGVLRQKLELDGVSLVLVSLTFSISSYFIKNSWFFCSSSLNCKKAVSKPLSDYSIEYNNSISLGDDYYTLSFDFFDRFFSKKSCFQKGLLEVSTFA